MDNSELILPLDRKMVPTRGYSRFPRMLSPPRSPPRGFPLFPRLSRETINRINFPTRSRKLSTFSRLSPSPRRSPSPLRRSLSPRRSPSPIRRSPSPIRRSPSPGRRSPSPGRNSYFFKDNNNLTEKEEKYCRCVLKVGEKQPESCNLGEKGRGRCYNPYAVCAKSVGTTSRRCGENYNFEELSDEQIKTYARLSKIAIPRPYDRQEMLNIIYKWKRNE